jgi:hypothetical protein
MTTRIQRGRHASAHMSLGSPISRSSSNRKWIRTADSVVRSRALAVLLPWDNTCHVMVVHRLDARTPVYLNLVRELIILDIRLILARDLIALDIETMVHLGLLHPGLREISSYPRPAHLSLDRQAPAIFRHSQMLPACHQVRVSLLFDHYACRADLDRIPRRLRTQQASLDLDTSSRLRSLTRLSSAPRRNDQANNQTVGLPALRIRTLAATRQLDH